jgi:hypothetical protein
MNKITIKKDNGFHSGYYFCTINLFDGYLTFGYEDYNHYSGEVSIYKDRYDNEKDYINAIQNKLNEIKKRDKDFYNDIIKACVNNGITKWGEVNAQQEV